MKKCYSILFLAFALLQNMTAKEIYLSSKGSDSNDGLTVSTPVKSLLRVNEIVESGDVVHVSGIIKITEEPGFAEKRLISTDEPVENGMQLYHRGYRFRNIPRWSLVTLVGEDNTKDGFSGEKTSPLFQIEEAVPLIFKNLLFTKAITYKAPNGEYDSSSSAFWCRNPELSFENCVFSSNEIKRADGNPAEPGGVGERGALLIEGGNTSFTGCEFTDNVAKEGGALFLMGGNVNIDKCYFGYNVCDELNDSKGGAIYTWVHGAAGELNLNISRTVFEGNTARKGGAIALLDKVSYSPTATNVTIDRCSFIGNEATQDQAGAIVLDNMNGTQSKDILTITNTLFYANGGGTDGGCICVWNVQPNSKFTMVNSTLYGNYTYGNAGHGAGLIFMQGYETYVQSNIKKKIYNSIFDGNYAKADGTDYSDLCFRVAPIDGELDIQNSYLGWTVGVEGTLGVAANNNLNYYTQTEYDDLAAGFDDPDYYAAENYAIPLVVDAATRTFGNAQFLTEYNITRDLSGKLRTIQGAKCAIGANETTAQELDDNTDFEDGSGISTPTLDDAKIVISNGILVCLAENVSRIELYSLTGNKLVVGEKSVRVNDLPTGVYVARVTSGETVSAQKVLIK